MHWTFRLQRFSTFMGLFVRPFRLRKLKERRKPLVEGTLGSHSPVSWANSSPGRSMSRVMLQSTRSVKACGCSCLSLSTKKSGLKITGWLTFGFSWLINTLHVVPLFEERQPQRLSSELNFKINHSDGQNKTGAIRCVKLRSFSLRSLATLALANTNHYITKNLHLKLWKKTTHYQRNLKLVLLLVHLTD